MSVEGPSKADKYYQKLDLTQIDGLRKEAKKDDVA